MLDETDRPLKPDGETPRTEQAAYPTEGQAAEVPLHHRRALRESTAEQSASARRKFEAQLEEAHLLMQMAGARLRQLEDDSYLYMTNEHREELVRDIDYLSRKSQSLRERCVYCRRELTTPMGMCSMCGREVCNECGQAVDDVVVHRGNCAMFYQQDREKSEPTVEGVSEESSSESADAGGEAPPERGAL